MANWNVFDIETYLTNSGVIVSNDKPEIDPELAIFNIFPDDYENYNVFVGFEGRDNIEQLWHAYSLVINAYM